MNIWQVQKINLKEKCKIALEKQFNENTSEKDISKMKVSFSSNSIIVEFWGSDDFGGKTLIVKWEAILDTSFNNQETIKWAKPYENDEIDNKTKRIIVYHLCVKLSMLDYIGYRNEYLGDEIRKSIDTIIDCGGRYV